MISFIVIGRNEGQHLERCLKSIHQAIKVCQIEQAEIIYVDSNSTDASLCIALNNNLTRVIQLTRTWNPPIGRNVGVANSGGEVLCFLDGDMEICSGFLKLVLNEDSSLKYPLVTGNATQAYYGADNRFLECVPAFPHIKQSFQKPITGGAFLTSRELYLSANGMDNRFNRGADPELGLRLAKRGFLVTFLLDHFIIHHTERKTKSLFNGIWNGSFLYGNLLMYKLNMFNKYMYMRLFRHDPTLLILFICIFSSVLFTPAMLSLYPIALVLRVKKPLSLDGIYRLLYFFVRDILVVLCFPFFYRKRIHTRDVSYRIVSVQRDDDTISSTCLVQVQDPFKLK